MAVIASLSVKMPVWRLRFIRVLIPIIAPFIRSEAAADRIISPLAAWVGRGLVVTVK